MHFGDGRFVAAPQAHEVVGESLHHAKIYHRVPRHVLRAGSLSFLLGEFLQIVA